MKFFLFTCEFLILFPMFFGYNMPFYRMNDYINICADKRTKPRHSQSPIEPSGCSFMVPGLSYMEHGTIENLFYESFEDFFNPKFEKVFSFTCTPRFDSVTKKFRFHNVPTEIYRIGEKHQMETREKRILSVQAITQELINDENIPPIRHQNDNFSNLPFFHFNEKSNQTVGYLRITTCTHEAQLRHDVKPNDRVMNEYRKLPVFWRNNVKAYYNFIMQFGTHVRQTTKFGGSLFIMVPYGTIQEKEKFILLNDNISVNELLEDTLKMKGLSNTKVVFHAVGGSTPLVSVKEWVNSVFLNPIPIESTFIPMNEFLDTSGSLKSKSLAEFIEFEKDYQMYKEYFYKLKLTKQNNITNFPQIVYEFIENQLQNVCPSKILNKVILDGLEKEKNYKFEKFWFKCTHKVKDGSGNDVRIYYLSPYICIDRTLSYKDCFNPSFKLPKDKSCIEMFLSYNCEGEATKVNKANDIPNLFGKVKSYRICV